MSEEKRKRKNNIAFSPAEHGKVPPQAVDLEEVVLGASMLQGGVINTVIELITPDMLYKEAHQRILKAMVALNKQSHPIDYLAVTQQLRSTDEIDLVGGAYYIASLTNRVASAANVEHHCRIIIEKHLKRSLISAATELLNIGYDEGTDVFDAIETSHLLLDSVIQGVVKKKEKGSSEIFSEFTQAVDKAVNSTEEITGIMSGISELDKLTNGWQNSDLIILAARPAMGKTALSKKFAKSCAQLSQKPILFFSLEMSTLQLAARFISEDVEIPSNLLLSGKFNNQDKFYNQVNGKIADYFDNNHNDLLIIDDTPEITIAELRSRAKRVYREKDIGLIIVDYLQLIKGSGDRHNREGEISEISRGLKILAKELNIPVIALSQLNRGLEHRGGDKRPMLSDLRESGAIEQDADVVTFLYRPEVYGFDTIDSPLGDVDTAGYAEIIVAKHRNGGLKSIPMTFTDVYTKFEDYIVQPIFEDNFTPNSDALKDASDDFFNEEPY